MPIIATNLDELKDFLIKCIKSKAKVEIKTEIGGRALLDRVIIDVEHPEIKGGPAINLPEDIVELMRKKPDAELLLKVVHVYSQVSSSPDWSKKPLEERINMLLHEAEKIKIEELIPKEEEEIPKPAILAELEKLEKERKAIERPAVAVAIEKPEIVKKPEIQLAETEAEVRKRLLEKYPNIFPNPMLVPKLFAVTINSCIGASRERLDAAIKILTELTGQKPVLCKARKTIKQFGIRKGLEIAAKVTLRGEKAFQFLKKVLAVYDYKVYEGWFDRWGNFSFGIDEHIKIPGTRYVPELGIIGFDVSVSFERPGYRVSRRKRCRNKIPVRHRLTPEITKLWIKEAGFILTPGKPPKEVIFLKRKETKVEAKEEKKEEKKKAKKK